LQGVRSGIYQRVDLDRSAMTLQVSDRGVSDAVVSSAGVWSSDEGVRIAANIHPTSIALAPNSREAIRSAFLPIGTVRFTEQPEQSSSVDGRGDRVNFPDGLGEMDAATSAQSRSEFWSFALLVLALVLFLAEGVLSRIFSHASLARASSPDVGIATVGRVRARTGSLVRANQDGDSTRANDNRIRVGGAP